ncbi:putative serine carboxypeptidase [Monocercomonoides exilis]|uniref:putative serine carboxypeptidase n=1 Tax=Monocercomonoides exilis TaxID=2049356 RepID=UPI00355A1F5C|nr:putative serine carboxypeptidase [Monocercomonoides exilis]|eukprot:MONOS_11089.1-p1 / transcript=MONOS_11089.1 / gene=MONOS_11089 / organism=Monocercomonoides_exilis_PA203 / gene_product=ring finger / transcript_product=ring finger / location=Mono_scaffold00537:1733-3634(+) / protein_length=633 / sequence_SO=supercontig / SO=protein_coding / is_pseudo=false
MNEINNNSIENSFQKIPLLTQGSTIVDPDDIDEVKEDNIRLSEQHRTNEKLVDALGKNISMEETQIDEDDLDTIESKVDLYVQEVLCLFPDIDLDFLRTKVSEKIDEKDCATLVINEIAEKSSYPKQKKKGESSKCKRDYKNIVRIMKPSYTQLSTKYLSNLFPLIPIPRLTEISVKFNYHLIPIIEHLEKDLKIINNDAEIDGKKFHLLKKPRKQVDLEIEKDEDFKEEYEEIQKQRLAKVTEADLEVARKLMDKEYEEAGGELLECGCCMGSYAIDEMVQCTEMHLICNDCAKQAILKELQKGKANVSFQCVDMNGCEGTFPDSFVRRVLSEEEYSMLLRREQQAALRTAAIPNLVECPFCDYAVIMETSANEDTELHCANPDCMKVSCRLCKKESHLPKKCSEVAEEALEESLRKAVEAAMDAARIRECPSCKKSVVKMDGCNRVPCECGESFCYVCGALCPKPDPYKHFHDTKCPLWNNNEDKLEEKRIKKAAKDAEKKWRSEHPEAANTKLTIKDVVSSGITPFQPDPVQVPAQQAFNNAFQAIPNPFAGAIINPFANAGNLFGRKKPKKRLLNNRAPKIAKKRARKEDGAVAHGKNKEKEDDGENENDELTENDDTGEDSSDSTYEE